MINLVIGYYSGYTSLDTDKGGLRAFVESFRKNNKNDFRGWDKWRFNIVYKK